MDSRKVLYSKGGNDECMTPSYAIYPILKYIPKNLVIWCPFDKKDSEFVKILSKTNEVIYSHIENGEDFYNYEPEKSWDIIISNPPFCYDEKTEVLTLEGWKFLPNVTKKDKIMSLNVFTKDVCYADILDITKQSYKGDMYAVNSKYIDLFVTPNHRMVSYKNGKPYLDKKTNDLIEIKNMKGVSHFNLDGYNWDGVEVENITIPEHTIEINGANKSKRYKTFKEKSIKMDDWLAFFGLWLADGHCRGVNDGEIRYDVGIKQHISNSGKVRTILKKLGYDFKEYLHDNKINFNIFNPQLHNFLFKFGNSKSKYIPKEYKNLSKKQIKILLDNYLFGDSFKSGNGLQVSTMSKKLADDLSECFLKVGVIVSLKPRKVFARGKNYGVIYQGQYNKNGENQKAKISKGNISIKQFNNYVYGLSLSKNYTMLVRRNGKIVFSGNTNKRKIFERCLSFNKPFALLMSNTWLNDSAPKQLFKDKDLQLLMFDKRIKYENNGIVQDKITFSSSYYCYNFLPKQIIMEFLNIIK